MIFCWIQILLYFVETSQNKKYENFEILFICTYSIESAYYMQSVEHTTMPWPTTSEEHVIVSIDGNHAYDELPEHNISMDLATGSCSAVCIS
jgi:hypothetical protein